MKKRHPFSSFVLLICGFYAAGCASTPAPPTTPMLTLEKTDQIIINQTMKQDVETLFGSPTVIISLKDAIRDVWIYCDPAPCSEGRLTLHLDRTSGLVKSFLWMFKAEDGKITVQSMTERYASSRFQKKKLIFDFKDYFERVTIWVDAKTGITLRTVAPHSDTIAELSRKHPNETDMPTWKKDALPIVREDK